VGKKPLFGICMGHQILGQVRDTRAHTYTRMHTQIQTRTQACTHAHTHTKAHHMHLRMCARAHTHAFANAHTACAHILARIIESLTGQNEMVRSH
jgi:anthranilate/para-aminobenzoate synthase component II